MPAIQQRGSGPGLGGRLFATLVLSIFLVAGLFMAWAFGQSFWANLLVYRWTPTECHILSSNMTEDAQGSRDRDSPYHFAVIYEYTTAIGARRVGDRLTLTAQSYSSVSDVNRLLARYPAGERVTGYVNPQDPTKAVLERQSLWAALTLLFPLVFIALGGGGLYALWRFPTAGRPKPISDRSRTATWGLPLFGGVFCLIGGAAGYFMVVVPTMQILGARSWPEVPCQVLSSRVATHSDHRSFTYSIDIRYTYRIGDRSYQSDRYSFFTGSSSGRSPKQEVVDRYPPGQSAICYVDPADPASAVLFRGFDSTIFFGLIPFVFVLIGLFVMVLGKRFPTPGSFRGTLAGSPAPPAITESAGPLLLKPSTTRRGKLIGTICAAVFWCGITSVFANIAIRSWHTSSPEYFLSIFMIPFVGIGLLLLGSIPYQILAMSNPTIELTLNPGVARLGGEPALQWRLQGRTEVLKSLSIVLEAYEECTIQSGKSSSTEKRIFHRQTVVKTSQSEAMRAGSARLQLPGDSMHSFRAFNGRIYWTLQIQGEIPRWPDLSDDFPLTVLPRAS